MQGDNIHIDVSLMGIKIGGGALGFKAEVTITLNIGSLISLKFCGKVCAPLAGC